jgi:hypothetical protein
MWTSLAGACAEQQTAQIALKHAQSTPERIYAPIDTNFTEPTIGANPRSKLTDVAEGY